MRPRIIWTSAFAVASGFVEAAVVVYLRLLVYPEGFELPLRPIAPPVLAVELAREAATLVMLAAVAMLAGRTRWQRFAVFLLAFGGWDLAYYAGLKLVLGWPPSLATWDVLFLLPWPWLGPVYAPVTVAALMIGFGVLVLRQQERGARGRADAWSWLLGAAGALSLLYTWLCNIDASLRSAWPEPYRFDLFALGSVLLTACGVRFLRISRRELTDPRP